VLFATLIELADTTVSGFDLMALAAVSWVRASKCWV